MALSQFNSTDDRSMMGKISDMFSAPSGPTFQSKNDGDRPSLSSALRTVAGVSSSASTTPTGPGSAYMVNAGQASSNPDAVLADLTRKQYAHWRDTYQPLEQEAINRAMNPDLEAQAGRAETHAARAFAGTEGMIDRQNERLGYVPSAREEAASDRLIALERSRSVGAAGTISRRATRDDAMDARQKLTGIGRGVATNAATGLNQAANMQNARDRNHQANMSAYRSNQMSGIGTALGTGLGLYAAGAGAAASAGAGLGLAALALI